MEIKMITLTQDNLEKEHLCCAIADKKHQTGINAKRRRLAELQILFCIKYSFKIYIEMQLSNLLFDY